MKAAGVDFAILRLGYRGHTEGLLYVDETFERNLENAEAAGIAVGVYFFSQATSKGEAEEEMCIRDSKGAAHPFPAANCTDSLLKTPLELTLPVSFKGVFIW